MNDKMLIDILRLSEDPMHSHAAARLTALAEENERLRKAVRDAHCAIGADGGMSERDCECEVCRAEP